MDKIYWKRIWGKKERCKSNDLAETDGYENVPLKPEVIANKITKMLKIKKTDRVMEVGCGAEALARYFDCDYVGIDYSRSLVMEADNIIFKDKVFDKCIAYSVFHYFPSKQYARKVFIGKRDSMFC